MVWTLFRCLVVQVTIMAARMDTARNMFIEIVSDVDLYQIIVDKLPIASCPPLLCAHRACTHDGLGIIELLGSRLHHGFETTKNDNGYLIQQKLQITPFYEERIPYWKMRFVQVVKHCNLDVITEDIEIVSVLGNFVEVGNYMWDYEHNIEVLAMEKLCKICVERPNEYELSQDYTNAYVGKLYSFHDVFMNPLYWMPTERVAKVVKTKVSYLKMSTPHLVHNPTNGMRTNRKVISGIKLSLDKFAPHACYNICQLRDARDCRSPLDSKPNAPFVSNLELNMHTNDVPAPYKSIFKSHVPSIRMLDHDSSRVFAAFGVAAAYNKNYNDLQNYVDTRLNSIVNTLIEMGNSKFMARQPRLAYNEPKHYPALF